MARAVGVSVGPDQITYLVKVDWSPQKLRGRHPSRPRRPFWGPLAAILDFTGGAALQAVSECPGAARLGFSYFKSALRRAVIHKFVYG